MTLTWPREAEDHGDGSGTEGGREEGRKGGRGRGRGRGERCRESPVSSIVIHESVIGEGSDPGTEDAGQMSVRKDGHVDFVPRYQRRREQRDVQDRNTFNQYQIRNAK